MQLTRFSDISLRILMYLASRAEPSPAVTVRAASTLFNVPYTHMVKVVHQLGLQGLLITTRGKGGGVSLSRPSRQIHIGDVLRMTEAKDTVINCFNPPCPLRQKCLLKTALDRAYDAFFEEMNRYTLEDVARTPALQRLVALSA
jgi:Rrf2 family nitric oxide-sensitive transcriptional repressor